MSPKSRPRSLFRQYTVANEVVAAQPALTRVGQTLDPLTLPTIVGQLEGSLEPERLKEFETLISAVDRAALNLPHDSSRDVELERELRRITQNYSIAEVIPEPFSLVSLRTDLNEALADPTQLPTPQSVSEANALLAAEWLQKIGLGQVSGYDLHPAEPALRDALREPKFASQAIDALSRISSGETQQDLLNIALTEGQPDAIRLQAADRTITHIQRFGRLIPMTLQQALDCCSTSIERSACPAWCDPSASRSIDRAGSQYDPQVSSDRPRCAQESDPAAPKEAVPAAPKEEVAPLPPKE